MFLDGLRKKWMIAAAASLFLVLAAELFLSIRQESQTFDESAHLYAGYSYWKTGDFGINPEHPPLAKLVAALPVLPLGLSVPPPLNIHFRAASVMGGLQLLYSHDADALLFRSRAAISIFTFALGLLLFMAGYEMFGAGAALIALFLFVFEPNILAHGALVATDMGITCCLFAAVYSFYRYVKHPSVLRLAICGVLTGLTLSAKHSGVLVIPIFVLLAVVEIVRYRAMPATDKLESAKPETRSLQALRLLGAIAVVTVISIAVLWSFYGFRYAARPGKLQIAPPTAAYLRTLHQPAEVSAIQFCERYHLLPEAYLYGFTDVAILSHDGRPAFLLGKMYPEGRWFYFPVAFAIKSTLGFLLLLALLVVAKSIRRPEVRRELLFMAIPPLFFFAVAMSSKLDIGLRHVLPVYPFLIVLTAAGAWGLTRQSRRWGYIVVLLLIFHAVSSLTAYPNYLPYSNELWGGPSNTYKVLSDSNVGWEGGLKGVQNYVSSHRMRHCWLAYEGPVDPAYYHIPCSPLPTFFSFIIGRKQQPVPEQIQGPVLISSQTITGFGWGPEDRNPYRAFKQCRPDAVLQGEILVCNGSFNAREISAVSHLAIAYGLLTTGHPDRALPEAQTAAALDPDFLFAHEMLSSLYAQANHRDEALREYQTSLHLYRTVYSEFVKSYPPPQNPFPDQRSE